jgi:branched-chain amino acid aminotransferase
MELPYSVEDFVETTKETIRVNGIDECYIRPLAYRGYGVMGLDCLPAPVQCTIAVWPWGSYLGEDSLKHGVKAGISSWRQRGNNATPPQIKATGNYINSSFARVEANAHGYDEAILLNEVGNVCEGTGENIFVVRDGLIATPPVSDGLLEGITRDSVVKIATDLGYDVTEASLVRTDLYAADEIFMCGTAAEIVPVRSVDQITIGEPGAITQAIQAAYFRAVRGEDDAYASWLEYVAK